MATIDDFSFLDTSANKKFEDFTKRLNRYEIKNCESEKSDLYTTIFNQFGHTGSLKEYTYFAALNGAESQVVCRLVFMIEDNASHLLFPMINKSLVSGREADILTYCSMKHVIDYCEKNKIAANTYIGPSKSSAPAQVFGFTKTEDIQEIGGKTFYEFSKPQALIRTSDDKKTGMVNESEATPTL